MATPGQGPDRAQEVAYSDAKVIGNGSFGVVYQAKLCDTGEMVAIKKVLQDKRFKVSRPAPLGSAGCGRLTPLSLLSPSEPRAADHEAPGALQYRQVEIFLLFQWRKGGFLLLLGRV